MSSKNLPLSYPRQRIIDYIKENGPVSVKEIYTDLDFDPKFLRATMVALRSSAKLGDRRLVIKDWKEYDELKRVTVRPRYMLLPKHFKDAPRPPPLGNLVRCQRYRNKRRVRVNSIFMLGTPEYARRLGSVLER